MTDVSQRLDRLEAELARQTAELDRLRSERSAAPTPSPSSSTTSADQTRDATVVPGAATRRTLFRTGAVAAGAAITGSLVTARPAAATDGLPLDVGAANSTAAGNTRLIADPGALMNNRNVFTVSDNATSSAYESAIGAVAQGRRVTNGVYAFTDARDSASASSTGHAVVARRASGGRSNIYMPPNGSSPTNDSYAHVSGELRVDFNGSLWYCAASGSPGTWRKLAGFSSSGAIHAIAPSRVYDSRFGDGPLAGGADRLVAVADRIDVATGAIVQVDVVPAGATAVHFNVTITSTVAQGFLSVSPGDAVAVTASTINWSVPNLTAANASLSTLDSARRLRVFAGGDGASTEFIVDITGYTV